MTNEEPLRRVRDRASHRANDLLLLDLCLSADHRSRRASRAPEPLIAHALLVLDGPDAVAERKRWGGILAGCPDASVTDPWRYAVEGVRHPDLIADCPCHGACATEFKGSKHTADNVSRCCSLHGDVAPGSVRYPLGCWAIDDMQARLTRGKLSGLEHVWVAPGESASAPPGWRFLPPSSLLGAAPSTDVALLVARAAGDSWGVTVPGDDGRGLLGVSPEEVNETRTVVQEHLAAERARRAQGGMFGKLKSVAFALDASFRDDRDSEYWEAATIIADERAVAVNWRGPGGLRAYRADLDLLCPGSAAARHWRSLDRQLRLESGGAVSLHEFIGDDLTSAFEALLEAGT